MGRFARALKNPPIDLAAARQRICYFGDRMLAGVTLDSLFVSNLSTLGVESGCPPSLSLAEQIPALVQHYLKPPETLPVSIICGAMRLALEEFVFLSCKLVDMVSDLLVIHSYF
jgi:hypothetical protein